MIDYYDLPYLHIRVGEGEGGGKEANEVTNGAVYHLPIYANIYITHATE